MGCFPLFLIIQLDLDRVFCSRFERDQTYFFYNELLFDKKSGTGTWHSKVKSSFRLYLIIQNVTFILLVDLYHSTGADS